MVGLKSCRHQTANIESAFLLSKAINNMLPRACREVKVPPFV